MSEEGAYLQKLKTEFKQRRARIANAAYDKPKPIPIKQEPPIEHYVPPMEPGEVLFTDICKAVCRFYRVTMLDVISQRRLLKLVKARHVIAYIASQHTRLSLPQIGSRLGGRDRSTISYVVEKFQTEDPAAKIMQDVSDIKTGLGV